MLTFIKIHNLNSEIKINSILENLLDELPMNTEPPFNEDYLKKTVTQIEEKSYVFKLEETLLGKGNIRLISRTQLIESITDQNIRPTTNGTGTNSFYDRINSEELLKDDDLIMLFIKSLYTGSEEDAPRDNILNSIMFHKFSDLSPKYIILGNNSLGSNIYKINGPVLVKNYNVNKLFNLSVKNSIRYNLPNVSNKIIANDFLSLSFEKRTTDFNYIVEDKITTTIINEYLLVNKSIIYSYLQENNSTNQINYSHNPHYNEYINKNGLFKYNNQNNNRLPFSTIFFNIIYLFDMSLEDIANNKKKLKLTNLDNPNNRSIMMTSGVSTGDDFFSVKYGISYYWREQSNQKLKIIYNNILMKPDTLTDNDILAKRNPARESRNDYSPQRIL